MNRLTLKALLVVAALIVMALMGREGLTDDTSSNEDVGSADAADALYNGLTINEKQAREALEVLPIEKPRSMKGYNRDEQFPHWLSADKWGWENTPDASDCDARDAALNRDGQGVEPHPDTCTPEEGTWLDPYTGETITNSSDADIDHIVPLAAAYRAGADEWSVEQGTIYANSPLVAVTSGSTSNREKGDKGPEVWKPDVEEAECPYAIRWIAVKNEYGLNLISTEERDALTEMLDTCSTDAA